MMVAMIKTIVKMDVKMVSSISVGRNKGLEVGGMRRDL